jgi:hypothetical protein
MAPGPFAGTVRVRTDSETVPEITAEFSGVWPKGAEGADGSGTSGD